MPMGPYENWDACILDQVKKGHSKESANKICGTIKAKTEDITKAEIALLEKQIEMNDVERVILQRFADDGSMSDEVKSVVKAILKRVKEKPDDKDIMALREIIWLWRDLQPDKVV